MAYSDTDSKMNNNIKNQKRENSPDVKNRLNRYMYVVIISGLAFAVFLLIAGFFINIAGSGSPADYKNYEQSTLQPEKLSIIFNSTSASALSLFEYAGIFCLILVPVAGIICAAVFFACNKKYNLMIIAICVLAILILSAVIGFMK
ncbi:MAG: hypothetical protein BWY60_01158 [Actinobacteria bacterium ADurb.Bin346]|nr:MAG: hypothetical protein BWY60_01158 [Actinobacteria bacterium ADurb.Bin346]